MGGCVSRVSQSENKTVENLIRFRIMRSLIHIKNRTYMNVLDDLKLIEMRT